MNGSAIHVSATTSLEEARMGVGFSYRRSVDLHVAAVKAFLDARCEYSRLGSGALGMAMTADGRFDGYWEAHINIWDVAAGLCIVKEAGGWVSDFMQGDVFTNGNSILAATPSLAVRLMELTIGQNHRANDQSYFFGCCRNPVIALARNSRFGSTRETDT